MRAMPPNLAAPSTTAAPPKSRAAIPVCDSTLRNRIRKAVAAAMPSAPGSRLASDAFPRFIA
jgi:hypothetical protein